MAKRWPGEDVTLAGAFADFVLAGVAEYMEAGVATFAVISASVTSNEDDWDPTGLSALTASQIAFVEITADGAYNITGMVPPSGGCRLVIVGGTTADIVTFTDEDANSAAANRLLNGPITTNQSNPRWFVYSDAQSRWMRIA